MMDWKTDRRKDLVTRQAIERILNRYEKQTGESSADLCTQPRRLYESLLLELLVLVNGNYGCIMRLTGMELAETPFLELISSIGSVRGGRLSRQYDTLLNRKPDSLIETVLQSGTGVFANNKRSTVPNCLPDCRPPIDNFAVLTFAPIRQTPFIVFLANSDKPFNHVIVAKLQSLLDVFTRIHKSTVNNKEVQVENKKTQKDNRHYSRLLDASFNAVLTFDSAGVVNAVNPAFEKYFDIVSKKAMGISAKEFIAAGVVDRCIDEASGILDHIRLRDYPASKPCESVGFRSDGSEFPIRVSALFSRVEDNLHITLIIDDISDRYESARESEQAFVQLKTLTNLAPVGILQLAVDWTCQYANDMWHQLSDLTSEETIEKGWIDAIHRDDVGDTLEELRNCVCSNKIFKREVRLQQPLGAVTWVNLSATSMVDEQHRLSGFLIVVTDITEKQHAAERLRQLAHHDALTGLLNRMFFLDHLAEALHNIEDKRDVGLLCIDLDGFKAVNDSLGHDAGDSLLKEVAERLKAVTRAEDTVARLGGDEFMITLEHVRSVDECNCVADKVIEAMKRPFGIRDVEICISASVGIAMTTGDRIDADELIKRSDLALYRAKQNGKSRSEVFTTELNEERLQQSALNHTVRKAVEDKNLELYYQPQLDFKTNRIQGFEALLRMPESFGTGSMPLEVVDVLEETGLVTKVGTWALGRACRDYSQWAMTGLIDENCTVSVNISPKQLVDASFVDNIKSVLEKTEMPPHALVIEITETAFIDNAASTIKVIEAIKELGVKISLDDFGTGYSSLAYLSRLPLDHLKIDKSFVMNLEESPERLAIVRAIIALSKALGLDTVAEGVESQEVVEQLGEEGCDAYQGFIYSKPLSRKNISRHLLEVKSEDAHTGARLVVVR